MGSKKKKPKLLSHTRPPLPKKPTPSLSSRATRTLIRTHHTIQKEISTAIAAGDYALSAALQAQLDFQGGLETYQRASILGQSSTRGGDSSKVLIDWLEPLLKDPNLKKGAFREGKLRLLEVGALSPFNACSRSGMFDVERIDLHSQHPDILEQDFMKRPLPREGTLQEAGFDVVSLSLVVNYVGDSAERGEMLRRVSGFLRKGEERDKVGRSDGVSGSEKPDILFPALFLVLPASCVTNSRYLDESRLQQIMCSEGYEMIRRKMSKKLVYYLWRWRGMESMKREDFKKMELRPGGARNNFCIVMH
jgi:25S rRNA (adenine2142-N1)-methyltransferase